MRRQHTRAGTKKQWTAVIIGGAVMALLFGPNGPAGGFWGANGEDPTGRALAALAVYGLVEAAAFGIGIAFAVFGRRLLASLGAPDRLTQLTFVAIVWALVSWWPHGSFHQAIEAENFGALAAIEWGFHATMLVCGLIIASFFWRVLAAGPDQAPAGQSIAAGLPG